MRVTADNRLAIVADLGIDKLLVYDFNDRTGNLTADSSKFASLDPGDGPRHVAMGPSGRFVYVVNELKSSVTVFAYDARQGTLKRKQTITTLPAGFTGPNTTAEIVVDRQGRFLYVSNRGDDAIVVFGMMGKRERSRACSACRAEGSLRGISNSTRQAGGCFPSNQRSNIISLFQVGAFRRQADPDLSLGRADLSGVCDVRSVEGKGSRAFHEAILPGQAMSERPSLRRIFLSEFVGTAALVLVGLSLVILMFGTGSPMAGLLPNEAERRAITGFLFGTTGACIAFLRWGGPAVRTSTPS